MKLYHSTSNNNDVNSDLESYKDLNIEKNATIQQHRSRCSLFFIYHVELAKNNKFNRSMSHRGTHGKIVLLKIGLSAIKA